MDPIKQLFLDVAAVPQPVLDRLIGLWRLRKKLQRNENLVENGQTDTTLYFVTNGSFRIFYPYNGEEICVGFGYDNTLLCAYPSVILNAPSEYCIQAIKASEVRGILRNDFYALMEEAPQLERCWRKMTEMALMGKIEREKEMLTFTPEERLQRLFQRSPHVFQHIPKKYIASYLRMSPETLSRIRL